MEKGIRLALLFMIAASPATAASNSAHRNLHGLRTRSRINCQMVRAYVRQLGLAQAEAMARAAGMTRSQERQAKQCLLKRV